MYGNDGKIRLFIENREVCMTLNGGIGLFWCFLAIGQYFKIVYMSILMDFSTVLVTSCRCLQLFSVFKLIYSQISPV